MASTATIPDVELVSVGTWAAATGVTKVTREDLESMLAAHADGLVDHAPVKLGHTSDLNRGIGDGNPAYGWVVPTRIGQNAAGLVTLFGDLVGMPSQLAEVAPTAYRRRSVEIAWEVTTPQGKKYRAALTGIALLGAEAPAVKGLADVFALYSAQPTEERREAVEIVEGLEGQPGAVRLLAMLRAAGASTTELTEAATAAGARDTANVPPPVPSADNDGARTPQTPSPGDTVTGISDEKLRKALKLEADADVSAEVDRIIAEHEATPDPATADADATGGNATPAPGTPAAVPGETPGATATPTAAQPAAGATAQPETVSLSAGTWAEAQRDIEWARQRRRTEVLDEAMRAGKIAPAERGKFTSELAAGEQPSGWAAALERDEAGTTTLITGLAPRFATSELGAGNAEVSTAAADKAFDQFEAQVFGLDRTAPQQ